MIKPRLWPIFALGILLAPLCNSAVALPGQSTDEAVAWINAHPTLRGNGLVVKKSETPAHRFSFEALVRPPGRIGLLRNRTKIRSERLSFYDEINGVTSQRLVTSLRNIYGVNVYQDFQGAELIYQYPTQEMVERSRQQRLPLLEARKGELRLGENYAYWLEVTETESGKAFYGQLTVFLPEDMEKLVTELQTH